MNLKEETIKKITLTHKNEPTDSIFLNDMVLTYSKINVRGSDMRIELLANKTPVFRFGCTTITPEQVEYIYNLFFDTVEPTACYVRNKRVVFLKNELVEYHEATKSYIYKQKNTLKITPAQGIELTNKVITDKTITINKKTNHRHKISLIVNYQSVHFKTEAEFVSILNYLIELSKLFNEKCS